MVGRLVQRKREAKGLTQTELALKTGLRQTYISQVERGEIRLPRDHNLDSLGAALDVTRAEFYRAAGILEGMEEDEAPLGGAIQTGAHCGNCSRSQRAWPR